MIDILFEDEDFLVALKPSGRPSQPTVDKRRPDFFTQLKAQMTQERGADFYLALHHRLDRDTSGVMIFAKSKRANEPLAHLFKTHEIQKSYICFTGLKKVPPQWRVENHLAEKRDPKTKKMKMHSVKAGGDKAITDFRLLQTCPHGLVIEACPRTGRMHQIRVHLAERGLGIFGDDLYKAPAAPRLMLHAFALRWRHPFTHEELCVESPLPADMEVFKQKHLL